MAEDERAFNLKLIKPVTSKLLFWLCFLGLNALTLSPATYLPPYNIFNWWDKAQHAIGFGTLAILASLAYPQISKYRMALLLCFQGVAIEVLQSWSGYRYGDWQDAVADAVGVLLGLLIVQVLGKIWGKLSLQSPIDPHQN